MNSEDPEDFTGCLRGFIYILPFAIAFWVIIIVGIILIWSSLC